MISRTLRHIFTLDIRGLALFRIAMGSLLLLALVQFFSHAEAFLSDSGVLSRGMLQEYLTRRGAINFYTFGGDPVWVYLLLTVTVFACIAFIVGFYTRTATVVLWILLISLQNRNPLVLQGGDAMFRVLLFWSIFLPLGRCWSLDARRLAGLPLFSRANSNFESVTAVNRPAAYFGIGSVAFMLQVAAIYLVTSQTKTGLEWHVHGTAVRLSLMNPEFTTAFGTWFLTMFDPLLEWMTYGTIWAELLLPLLLFSPWRTHLVRLVGMAGLAALHVGIDLTMTVGFTSLAVFSGLLAFTPPMVFDRLRTRRRQSDADAEPVVMIGMRPRWAEFLAGFCLVWVAIMNLNTLGYPGSREILASMPVFPRNVLRLDQRWTMFSPRPPVKQSYLLAQGHLDNGKVVNMRTREAFDPDGPLAPWMPYFDNHRWRKYLANICEEGMEPMRVSYACYLAGQWNAECTGEDSPRVKEVVIWQVSTPLLEEHPGTSWTELVRYKVEDGSGEALIAVGTRESRKPGEESLLDKLPR